MTADEFRDRRSSMDMTQAEMASYLDISLSSVRRYERRRSEIPTSIARVVRAAERRGMPPGWLITVVDGEKYVRRPDGGMVSIESTNHTASGFTLSLLIDDLSTEWTSEVTQ